MATNINTNTSTNKVFLWGTPRSCTTSFLKCISQIEGVQSWYEPYMYLRIFGRTVTTSPKYAMLHDMFYHIYETAGGKTALASIKYGVDSSLVTSLQWIRDTLEGDFPKQRLVFIKELPDNIIDQMDLIPNGFKHTFLIRHPYRVALGLLGFEKTYDNYSMTMIRNVYGEGGVLALMRPMKYMYDVWEYVTKTFHYNGNSVILDADDLIENPAQMMRGFCQAVDIPFSESILRWEAGDAITQQWMAPKEWHLIKSVPGNDIHKSTFASTGFEKRFRKPLPSKDKLPLAWHAILDEEIEYYDKMYSKCLRV